MLSNKDRFMNGLGMCKRAGKVVYGDKLLASIKSRDVYMVVLANDASARTQKQIKDKASYASIPVIEGLSSHELSYAIGVTLCVAVGITDPQLIKVLEKNIQKKEVTVNE